MGKVVKVDQKELHESSNVKVVKVDQKELHESSNVKVHSLMCKELKKFVDNITQLLPTIESARPGSMAGIQALCSLNRELEKANLLLKHCAEASKLYLALTGEAILLKCKRIREVLQLSLSQIQNMVPQPLAAQVSEIVNGLRDAKFMVETSEEEAGKVILALLQPDKFATGSTEISEMEAFKGAALRLHITSPKTSLIEKRSLRKQLDQVHDSGQRKESILKYLLYLLSKYEKVVSGYTQDEDSNCRKKSDHKSMKSACHRDPCDNPHDSSPQNLHTGSVLSEADANCTAQCATQIPPEEFKCPISSKLMFDPVVIASGQTYERIWIERWFSGGHDFCPKTQKKLPNLSMIPNTSLKDLIFNWCKKHGLELPHPPNSHPNPPPVLSCMNASSSNSISSLFGVSLNDVPTPLLDNVSTGFMDHSDMSNVSISTSSDASCYLDSSDHSYAKSMNSGMVGSGGQALLFSQSYDDPHNIQALPNFSHAMYVEFLSKLATLPLESQHKAVEDVKIFLKDNDEDCQSMLSNGFVEAMIRFLKDAIDLSDVNSQKMGAQILLAFMSSRRRDVPCIQDLPCLPEEAFQLFASLLVDSKIIIEIMKITQILSSHKCCNTKIVASGALVSIVKMLDFEVGPLLIHAVKILSDLSLDSSNSSHILSSGCILKLIPLLSDDTLAGNCIQILDSLCDFAEEARAGVSETNGCIASVVELLENGTPDDQEHAVSLLLSLCSHSWDCCHVVMREGVIPPLVNTSINGNAKARESSMKLLQLLRDLDESDPPEILHSEIGSTPDSSLSSGFSKEKKPTFKATGFFKRKMGFFSKSSGHDKDRMQQNSVR